MNRLLVLVSIFVLIFALFVTTLVETDKQQPAVTGAETTPMPAASGAAQQGPLSAILQSPSTEQFAPAQLLVKFKPDVPQPRIDAVINKVGASVEKQTALKGGLFLLALPQDLSVPDGRAYFSALDEVEIVEPNYYYFTTDVPDDPSFDQQWGLRNDGQTGGTPGVDIGAVEAWETTTGNDSVYIAVIDSGTNTNYADLLDNIWLNPLEITGGFDDDGNGWVDDFNGIVTVPNENSIGDEYGHGHRVAITIAARGSNNLDTTGVLWDANLITCRAFDLSGTATLASLIECMDYISVLKDSGVDIVATNNSWGGGAYSELLRRAIERHNQQDILFVNAAGNAAVDVDTISIYPAAYDSDNIIAVAAIDHNGDLASFSNYGLVTVDIAAPGVDIFNGPQYTSLASQTGSGTSFAAPYVTGVVGLLKAKDPTMTGAQIRDWILATSEATPQLLGRVATGGMLKAVIPIRDHDGDLMDDDWELLYGLDPADPADAAIDTDSDGLTNLEEYEAGSSPLLSDTDSDGLSDLEETSTYLTDPANADTDGDGLSDFDEITIYGTSPLSADSDNDGSSDFDEVMSIGTSATDPDTDGDGMADGWEASSGLDPLDAADRDVDSDGDGVSNFDEFNAQTDPQSPDTDSDGLTDFEELNTTNTDPLNSDTDSDIMLDGWENANGLDPLDPADALQDSDTDAYSNRSESRMDTDPNSASSVPELVTWNSSRGSSRANSFVPIESSHDEFQQRWVNDIVAPWVTPRPTITGTQLIVDVLYDISNYAIISRRIDAGEVLWRTDLPGIFFVGTTIEVNGVVAFLANYTDSRNVLIGLNADSGELLYEIEITDANLDFTILGDGSDIFFGSDETLMSHDAITGAENWKIPVAPSVSWSHHIRAVNDTYVGDFAGLTLTMFDRQTGVQLSQAAVIGCGVTQTKVAFGLADDFYVYATGCVSKYDLTTLEKQWERGFQFTVEGIAVDESAVHIASTKALTSVNISDGSDIWTVVAPDDFDSNVVATLDHVFVSSAEGTRAFDRYTGLEVWRNYMGGKLALGQDGSLAITNTFGGTQLVTLQGDLDGDGAADWWEKYNGLDARDPADGDGDDDSDGLSNRDEFGALTNPRLADTDADGLSDSEEVNLYLSDPRLPDSDADTLPDSDEVNIYATDPNKFDSDGDRFSDAAELLIHASDPLDSNDAPVLDFSFSSSFEAGAPAGWTPDASSWSVDTTEASAGTSSLKAATIESGQVAGIEWSDQFDDGLLAFDARISSTSCCDTLTVLLDGQVQLTISQGAWQRFELPITRGSHTVRFEYHRNDSTHPPAETAWIDNLTFRDDTRLGTNIWNAMMVHDNLLYESRRDQTLVAEPIPIPNAISARGAFVSDDHRLVIADAPKLHFYDLLSREFRAIELGDHWDKAFNADSGNVLQVGGKFVATDNTGAFGLIVFDSNGTKIGTAAVGRHYNDLTLGDDGFIYGLLEDERMVDKIDQTSLQILSSIELQQFAARSIAVDKNSQIYTGHFLFPALDVIVRSDPEGRVLDALIINEVGGRARDLDIQEDGTIVVTTSSGTLGYIAEDFSEIIVHDVAQMPKFGPHIVGFIAVMRKRGIDQDGDQATDWWEHAQGFDVRTPGLSTDFDGDALSDLVEYELNTDPLVNDSDGDGVSDGAEVNLHGTNANIADTDGDGLTDGQEVNTYFTDPLDTDSDGDGLDDGTEVLELASNPLDADADGDGMGDEYEVANGFDPSDPDDAAADADNDGVSNVAELGFNTDPNNGDTDFDELSDGEEINNLLTDPTLDDSDQDNLPDGWEVHVGRDPLTAEPSNQDIDGDGFEDSLEYFAGSDPLVNYSFPRARGWLTDGGDAGHTGYVPTRLSSTESELIWSQQFTNIEWNALDRLASQNGIAWFNATNLVFPLNIPSIVAVDTLSGATLWRREGDLPRSMSPPAIHGEKLIFQTAIPETLLALDKMTGDTIYQTPMLGTFHRFRAPAILDDEVFLPNSAYGGVSSFNAVDGTENWNADAEQEFGWSPAVNDDFVFVYTSDTAIQELAVISRENGTRFDTIADDYVFHYYITEDSPVLGSRNNVVTSRPQRIENFDINRSEKSWERFAEIGGQPAFANGLVWAVESGELVAVDERDGSEVMRWIGPSAITEDVLATIDHVIVSTKSSVHAVDIQTGISAWSYPVGGSLSLGNDGLLMVATSTGMLHAIKTFADADNDGMSDSWEALNNFDNQDASDASADADADGLSNLQEFRLQSDVNNNDTDGDGLVDGEEHLQFGSSMFDRDTDSDGLDDFAEVNQYSSDPTKSDSDADNLNDADESLLYATDPTNPDSDADGVADGWEILLDSDPLDSAALPPVASGYAQQFEGGEIPNDWINGAKTVSGWSVVEGNASVGSFSLQTQDVGYLEAAAIEWTAYFEQSQISFDARLSERFLSDDLHLFIDGTLVPEFYDETWRSYVFNVDAGVHTIRWEFVRKFRDDDYVYFAAIDNMQVQLADSDSDMMPDQWETQFGLNPFNSGDAQTDLDQDGLINVNEYSNGTDPTVADSDVDGMPDGWEVDNGLDPLVDDAAGDPDNDGATNLAEYTAGTDPNRAPTPSTGGGAGGGGGGGGGGSVGSIILSLWLLLVLVRLSRQSKQIAGLL